MKRLIFILLTAAIPTFGWAQRPMTLRECLELGLERNYDIRLVRNLERIADNNATVGNAGFLPTVDLSAGYSGTLNDTKQFPADGGDAVTADGVHNHGASAGIDLGWTLFDGFRVQTNYKRLKELQSMGELETRMQVENFISVFTAEYYNYIRQRITLKNLEYAVELSRERVRIVDVSEQIGSLSGYDLLQARVDFNADSSRLIRQYEVLHTLSTQLNEMLAAADVDSELLAAATSIDYNPSLSREELLMSALENNVYMKLARAEGNISRLDLRTAQSANYPYLRLNGGYGYSNNRFGSGAYKRQRTMGPSYGVTLGFTIFDGMNRRREQRNARIVVENHELEQQQTELALNVDMANAWMAYQNNLKLIDLERMNLETARTGHELAFERYKNSQLSGIELREAQTSLLEAEERLVQVMYDTKMCEISLMQIAGRVSEYIE